jgi:hypothetical protein
MAKKKAAKKKSAKKNAASKNSLVGNINRRKKEGTSRSKDESTISPHAYEQMKQGWPNSKANRKKATKKSAK